MTVGNALDEPARTRSKRATRNPRAVAGMRLHNREVQTAVVDYVHPERPTITLVGTVHVAMPGYFAELRSVIEAYERQGAVVHREAINEVTIDPLDPELTESERSMCIEPFNEAEMHEFMTTVGFPFVRQSQALAPAATWTTVDIHMIDRVRMVSPRLIFGMAARRHVHHTKRVTRFAEFSPKKKRRIRNVSMFAWRHLARKTSRGRGRPRGPGRHVTDTWRKYHACSAAIRSRQDVVVIWGAGHLVGFGDILIRNGYKPDEPTWYTAFDARRQRKKSEEVAKQHAE